MKQTTAIRTPPLELLIQICECEPPETMRQLMLISELSRSYKQLIAVGALKHAANADSVLCTACDDVHAAMVDMPSTGRFRAYCPDVGYYDVPAEDLKVFAADLTWVAEATARGLGIPARSKIAELVPSILWGLGEQRFGKSIASIYLARLVDRANCCRDIKTALGNQHGSRPGIVFTSTRAETEPSNPLPRHLLLTLSDYAELRGSRLVFDHKKIERAWKGDAAWGQGAPGAVNFSPDYRHVTVGSEVYTFTPKQAEAIRVMHDAHKRGEPKLHQRHTLAEAGSDQKRMAHLFAGNPAFGAFIRYDRKGFYWLEL